HPLESPAAVEPHVLRLVALEVADALLPVEPLAHRRHQPRPDALPLVRARHGRRAEMPVVGLGVAAFPGPQPVPDPRQPLQRSTPREDRQHCDLLRQAGLAVPGGTIAATPTSASPSYAPSTMPVRICLRSKRVKASSSIGSSRALLPNTRSCSGLSAMLPASSRAAGGIESGWRGLIRGDRIDRKRVV